MLRYDGENCEGEYKEDYVPWNFCYKGLFRLSYKEEPKIIEVNITEEVVVEEEPELIEEEEFAFSGNPFAAIQ